MLGYQGRTAMTTRRQIIKIIAGLGLWVFITRLKSGISLAWARTQKRLLARDTPMEELISEDPGDLDTRQLDTTPMDRFDVMGQDIYEVNLDAWRLNLAGAVARPRALTYPELVTQPFLEKNCLLICPGFFAYNALWKGIALSSLLKSAGVDPKANRVRFSGPEGIRKKNETFDLQDVMADRVFIAYRVNGQPLPERHGFPARVVAEGHYGGRWVKYVNRIHVLVD